MLEFIFALCLALNGIAIGAFVVLLGQLSPSGREIAWMQFSCFQLIAFSALLALLRFAGY